LSTRTVAQLRSFAAGGERGNFADTLENDGSRRLLTSVLAVWEAAVAIYRKTDISMAEAEVRVEELIRIAGIETAQTTHSDLKTALHAFDHYWRHRYPDNERNSARIGFITKPQNPIGRQF
jgi:ribonuclease VapC